MRECNRGLQTGLQPVEIQIGSRQMAAPVAKGWPWDANNSYLRGFSSCGGGVDSLAAGCEAGAGLCRCQVWNFSCSCLCCSGRSSTGGAGLTKG
jgi:hypothetical protein